MSSKPYPAGATKLIEVTRRIGELTRDIPERARRAKQAQVEYSRANAELAELKRGLREHLDSMDCESVGNFGWEGRVGWLIGEVIRQIDAEKNEDPDAG